MAYAWGTTPMAMRDATLPELKSMIDHLERVEQLRRKASR